MDVLAASSFSHHFNNNCFQSFYAQLAPVVLRVSVVVHEADTGRSPSLRLLIVRRGYIGFAEPARAICLKFSCIVAPSLGATVVI